VAAIDPDFLQSLLGARAALDARAARIGAAHALGNPIWQ
jgi:hypothetical protein